jgi:hypothetical protein
MKAKRKPRKPRNLLYVWAQFDDGGPPVMLTIETGWINSEQARRLSRWLLKAADYLDEKETSK